jgi:hypothetical protein
MKSGVFLSVFAALVIGGLAANATVLLDMDVEDLAAAAPLVVTGEVNQVRSEFNKDRTKIYTRILITPDEVLKGPAVGGVVTIKILGGQVGDLVAHMPGAPEFEVGERVLVFLEPRKDGDGHLTVGMCQGKFKLFIAPETGEEMALRQSPGPGVKLAGERSGKGIERAWKLQEIRDLLAGMEGAQ